jgi:predicted dienelactone hydrolase
MRAVLLLLLIGAAPATAQPAPAAPHILRAPTGGYAVGTRIYHWTDSSRFDPATPAEGDHRQLTVQLWYPTDATDGPRAPYMPELDVLRPAFRSGAGELAALEAPAVLDAPLRHSTKPYPIVVFSPGMGNPRALYTSLVAEWASHGYVVAAIDHPGIGLVAVPGVGIVRPYAPWTQAPPGLRDRTPEERDAFWAPEREQLSADQRFVIDQLAGLDRRDPTGRFTHMLDTMRIAEAGHSDGFVSLTCAADPRIAACLNLDGVPALAERRAGLHVPYMTIRDGDDAPAVREIFATNHAATLDVIVGGAVHNSSTDLPLLANSADTTAGRVFDAIVRYSTGFFDAMLCGKFVPFLDVPVETPALTVRRYR